MDETFQLEIERLFNKNQLVPRLREVFKEEKVFLEQMERYEIPHKFGLTVLAQIWLHRRANLPTMVGLLRHHAPDKKSQTCANLLLKCAEADFLYWFMDRQEFMFKFDITTEVQLDLERYQYPLPMVIPPKEITNNLQTGYLTIKNSIILRDNHHDGDVCLDHINSVNKIKLRINSRVAQLIQNSWKNLDHAKEGEDYEEYQKRVKAFQKYDRTARDVMQLLEISSEDGTFYLTHKYDKRGRCYSQGYHVNYQGNAWNKAVIEFAKGEIVNG